MKITQPIINENAISKTNILYLLQIPSDYS